MHIGFGLGLWQQSAGFNPLSLFAAGEQGAWYDPSDLSTLFQDAAGTIPVTAAGQPVGLMLDKRLGLMRGPEQLINNDFANDGSGWTVTNEDDTHKVTFANGTARFQSDTLTPVMQLMQSNLLVIGKTYEFIVVTSAYVSGLLKIDCCGVSQVMSAGIGTVRYIGTATSTTFSLWRNTPNVDVTIDSVSVRELPGNHASQSTATSRPILQFVNGLWSLVFDGIDDGMLTGNIDFSATDEMTVFAGARRLSDAATAFIMETSIDSTTNNGAVMLRAPSGAAANFMFGSRGTVTSFNAVTSAAAPVTAVITGQAKISTDTNIVRMNGSQAGVVATDQGTGNYGNYPLYIGRRANTGLPFNGNLYGLIMRGVTSTDQQVTDAENWMNSKTGAY